MSHVGGPSSLGECHECAGGPGCYKLLVINKTFTPESLLVMVFITAVETYLRQWAPSQLDTTQATEIRLGKNKPRTPGLTHRHMTIQKDVESKSSNLYERLLSNFPISGQGHREGSRLTIRQMAFTFTMSGFILG